MKINSHDLRLEHDSRAPVVEEFKLVDTQLRNLLFNEFAEKNN